MLRLLVSKTLRAAPVAVTLMAGLSMSNVACAQSLFGSSGALSSTSAANAGGGRSSSSGGMVGGSSAFGSGSSGGMLGSSSSGGMGATGMGGTGQSTLTQSMLNAGDGSLGQTVGTSGFVGRGDTAGRFVGSQNASRQQVTGGGQQFSALQNRNNQNNSNTEPPKSLMRPRVRLGFESPFQEQLQVLPTMLETHMASLPAIGTRADGVHRQVDATGTVTLTGKVASEEDRRMMEILTRMEPGVRDVKNELHVGE